MLSKVRSIWNAKFINDWSAINDDLLGTPGLDLELFAAGIDANVSPRPDHSLFTLLFQLPYKSLFLLYFSRWERLVCHVDL
jgi:hypothetical protein